MLDTDNEKETMSTTFSTNSSLHLEVEVTFTQMSAKKGIARFGERAVCVIIKEYKQLDQGSFRGNPMV